VCALFGVGKRRRTSGTEFDPEQEARDFVADRRCEQRELPIGARRVRRQCGEMRETEVPVEHAFERTAVGVEACEVVLEVRHGLFHGPGL
jgi:hypothetical protein